MVNAAAYFRFAAHLNGLVAVSHVLILGAGSDVGVACAHHFAQYKFNLYLAGRNMENLQPLSTDIRIRYKVEVIPVLFDALDFSAHAAFVQSLQPLPDVAICVFGMLGDQKAAENDWQACKKILDTNYTGAVSVMNILAQQFEARGSGVLVGISSVAGERGRQSNYIYGSAKAGFTAYLSGLRNRLYKKGVHVMTVKPGFINTRMTEHLDLPKPLTAQPAQVARAIFNGARKKANTIYVLPVWWLIMLIIRNIPEFIFKRMKL